MPDLISIVLPILLLAVVGVGAVYRVRQMTATTLTDEQLEKLGHDVLMSWRAIARDTHTDVPMTREAWASYGVTPQEAIQLARDLVRRGQIVLPEYGLIQLLMGEPPTAGRLTQNSWEAYGPHAERIIVNGPAHFGAGDQHNSGTFSYHWEATERDLTALSCEAESLIGIVTDPRTRAKLSRAVGVVDDVIERRDVSDPRLPGALRWLGSFAGDTASGALGSIVASLATRLLDGLAS